MPDATGSWGADIALASQPVLSQSGAGCTTRACTGTTKVCGITQRRRDGEFQQRSFSPCQGAAAAGNFNNLGQFDDMTNLTNLIVAQNIGSYSVFAAYRDARLYNGEGGGYRYQMPTDSFADLAAAPFKLSVLKKPEVWGGLLGALSFAAILEHFLMPNDAHIKCSVSTTTFPLSAFSVGIGEEALFRGYLQSYFAESMSPTAAIINSSLLFGAAHIGNAARLEAKDQWRYYAFGLPFITAFGGYFGWLTHKNRSLKESVAIHSWYDFILFTGMAFAGPSAMAGKPEFAFAFTF